MKKSRAIEILTDTIKDYETAVQNEREHPLYGRISSRKYINDLEKGIEALRFALRALEREGWIPVAERLPEDNERILINVKTPKHESVQLDTCIDDCGELYLDSGYAFFCDVSAWMPLPEPYGGDNT